jgi:hypothetical protein
MRFRITESIFFDFLITSAICAGIIFIIKIFFKQIQTFWYILILLIVLIVMILLIGNVILSPIVLLIRIIFQIS